jgi:hypothetical protein
MLAHKGNKSHGVNLTGYLRNALWEAEDLCWDEGKQGTERPQGLSRFPHVLTVRGCASDVQFAPTRRADPWVILDHVQDQKLL